MDSNIILPQGGSGFAPRPPVAPALDAANDDAEIGREFVATLLRFEPRYNWNESPVEWCADMIDRLDASEADRRGIRATLAEAREMGNVWHSRAEAHRTAAEAAESEVRRLQAALAEAGAGTPKGRERPFNWKDCDCGLCAQCNGQSPAEPAPAPDAVRAALAVLAACVPDDPAAPTWSTVAPKIDGEYWAVVSRWREPWPANVIVRIEAGALDVTAADDETYGYGPDQILLWGPAIDHTAPLGWREALAAAVPAAGQGAGE